MAWKCAVVGPRWSHDQDQVTDWPGNGNGTREAMAWYCGQWSLLINNGSCFGSGWSQGDFAVARAAICFINLGTLVSTYQKMLALQTKILPFQIMKFQSLTLLESEIYQKYSTLSLITDYKESHAMNVKQSLCLYLDYQYILICK